VRYVQSFFVERHQSDLLQFASYGFIVLAVEHRDGSGPRSFINQPGSGEVEFDKAGEKRDPKKFHKKHGDTHYDVVVSCDLQCTVILQYG
jgi:hypothetical protein